MTEVTTVRVLCPVCRHWFYREYGTRTKYDSDRCRKIGASILAGRKRRAARNNPQA